MVEGNLIEKSEKSKGSAALNDSLLYADVKHIAQRFNKSYTSTYNIISGKHFGDSKVVECAVALSELYKDVDLQNKRQQILESYGPTH